MQLTGDRFTQETAVFGNDLATFPNFPAEIRAPQGTLAGVSSFQLHFADHDILTTSNRQDILVAMNPAALKANIGDLPKSTTLIVDTHDFTTRALARVGWAANPLEDGSLDGFNVHAVDLTQLTLDALADSGPLAQGRRPLEEHVRARPAELDVLAAHRADSPTSSGRSSPTSPTSPKPTSPR